MTKPLSLLTCLVMCWLALSGCSRGRSVAKQLEKAKRAYDARDYETAKSQYVNILRKNPRETNAIVHLGKIFYRQGQLEESAMFLVEANRQFPDELEVAEYLSTVYLRAGQYTNARAHVQVILARQPTNETALRLLVEAARTDVERTQVVNELGALEKKAGPNPKFHMARALLAASRQDLKEAESELSKTLALDPKSVFALITLSQLRWHDGLTNQAEQLLRQAVSNAAVDDPAHFHLAGFLLAVGRVEEAKKKLEEINRTAPEWTGAWVLSAELAFRESRFDDCFGLLKRALGQAPNDYSAGLLMGKLKLAQKKPAEAVKVFQRIVDQHPRSADAAFQLGVAQAVNQEFTAASTSFDRAQTLDRNDSRPVLASAELSLKRGQAGAAITALEGLTQRQPKILPAQFLLVTAYLRDGKANLAIERLSLMNKSNPNNPAILFQMGQLLGQRRSFPEARRALEEAQSLVPNDTSPLEQLAIIDLAENAPQAAQKRLTSALELHPKAYPLWVLLARIYFASDKLDDTERALEKAIELETGAPAPYMMLAQVSQRRGDTTRAVQRLEDLLKRQPQNLGARIVIGSIKEQLGAFEDARKVYEEILKTNPDNVVALNNLAHLKAEQFGKVDEAHGLALKAAGLAPEDPSVADTLGWIEYRRGNYPEAVRLLKNAKGKLPGNPEVASHLGLSAYMLGDEILARSALTEALASPAKNAERPLSEQSLAILNLGGDRAPDAMIKVLEQRRKENPRDLVASVRLGIVYETAGRTDQARELYEAAYRLSPAAPEVLKRLAASEVDHDPVRARELARLAQRATPDDPEVSRILGRLALTSGDAASAYGLLSSSARTMTNRGEVWFDFGRAAFATGRPEEAEEAIKKTLKLGGVGISTNVAAQWLRLLLVAKAPTAENLGFVEQVLKSDATNGPALFAMAKLRELGGEYSAAGDLHERLLRQWPGFIPSVRQLAILYAEHLHQDDKARALATRARVAFPEDQELARTVAGLAFRHAEFTYAVQIYKEIARTQPNDGNLQFLLGRCYFQLKQTSDARAALEKAISLDPKGVYVGEAKGLLKQLTP